MPETARTFHAMPAIRPYMTGTKAIEILYNLMAAAIISLQPDEVDALKLAISALKKDRITRGIIFDPRD